MGPPSAHRFVQASAALCAGALAALALASSAQAKCGQYTWASSPRVVIHEQEFADDGGSLGDQLKMLAAVDDVVDTFNDIGGTSARVTKVETTTAPFDYGNATPNDPVPTIHFGWTHDIKSLTADGSQPGAITDPVKDASTCNLTTAYIAFPDAKDPGGMTWDYGTPFSTSGSSWFLADETDASGHTWFRPSFLHELLHAWGFKHMHGEYTFMTHRAPAGFPWANRAEADAVRPLPYEIGVLRDLYPATDSKYDVELTNTWYGPPRKADDTADGQHQLCLPSLGTQYAADDYDSGTCGVNGSTTTVCKGTTLKTRFTIANSSTEDMVVSAWLSFSRDDKADDSEPQSPTPYNTQLGAETSELQEVDWEVPSLSGLYAYHPIVHIVAEDLDADATSVRSDWIPLSGTVSCKPTPSPRL